MAAHADGPACVTLTGPGGAGKTRLAEEATAARDDAVWVECASVHDAETLVQRAATAIGAAANDLTGLAEALAERPGTLVIDNCEHLRETAAGIARAALDAGWNVLATSHEALAIDGERVIAVLPFAHPDPSTPEIEALARYDAVALFVQRATAVDPTFTLNSVNAPAVARICRRTDGIPLAIELAAARVAILDPVQIAERLSEDFALLRSNGNDVEPRRRSLDATIAWGFDLLDERERALLCRAAVFDGPFDLDALEQSCSDPAVRTSDVIDVLTALVAKSLIHVESGSHTTYRLLDPIRTFALARLDEPDRWRKRIIGWAVEFGVRARPGLAGGDQQLWATRLMSLRDTLLGAVASSRVLDPDGGLRICESLSPAWGQRGFGLEVANHMRALLDAAPDAPPPIVAGTHLALATLLANAGRIAEAEIHADAAVETAERTGDAALLVRALNASATPRVRQGRYADALEIFQRALALERDTPTANLGPTIANLATMYHEVRDLDRARVLYDEAAALFRASGDRARLGTLMMNQATLLQETGEFAAALELYDECLEIAVAMGELGNQCLLWTNVGNGHASVGRLDEAMSAFRESLRIAMEIVEPHVIGVAAQSICLIAAQRGEPAVFVRAACIMQHINPTWSLHDSAPDQREVADGSAAAFAALSDAEIASIRIATRHRTLDDLAQEALAVAARYLDGARGATRPDVGPPPSGRFRRAGDVWEIAFAGDTVSRLRDAKGLAYIARLLATPDQDVHVADLIAVVGVADAEGVRKNLGATDDAIDPAAARAYAERIHDLETERDEAVSWSDEARVERLDSEIEQVRAHLATTYGLSGRARRPGDPAERMRKAVTNRIRDALTRIGKESPALERFLRNALRTGIYCSYRPDRPVQWDL